VDQRQDDTACASAAHYQWLDSAVRLIAPRQRTRFSALKSSDCLALRIQKDSDTLEEKMNYKTSFVKLAAGLCCAALAGWLIAACSQTAAPGQSIVQRVEGEQPAPPPATGFLGSDYSLLQPPSSGSVPGQKAMLAYINPNANFSQYNQVPWSIYHSR
jgi:hypothetical protein